MPFDEQLSRYRVAILALVLVPCRLDVVTATDKVGGERPDFGRHTLARIPPGTNVGEDNASGWNRVVLLAKPRLAAGAVSKIPRMARSYATRFNVVIMARVSASSISASPRRYQLEKVGVGYCTEIAGKNIVISSGTQEKLGAELDTIERIILGQNEKVLDEMVQIARSNAFTLFDVKAIVLHNDKHQDMLVRHMVWVSPETGKVASLIWPLAEDRRGNLQLASKTLAALAGGFQEDRIIHVSADEITLGIPSARAFALAHMPLGKNIPADAEIAKLAAQKAYTYESLSQLIQAVRKAF